MENNQNQPKKSGRGGPRPNSGRVKGSTNKISGVSILQEIERQADGDSYEAILVKDFLQARYSEDKALALKYHQLRLNKVIADKIDITTNGQTLTPVLTFSKQELPEYQEVVYKEVK